MTMSNFFHELVFGAVTVAHYVADVADITGNLSDLSLLIYQVEIIIATLQKCYIKSNFIH